MGKAPMMKHMLRWAESYGSVAITASDIANMVPYLDEDPAVMSHLLWAFLNVNLTQAAREIFCNVPDSEGFEAWRRVYCHIFSRTERRRDELYRQIHDPKGTTKPHEVAGILEEWDTNQRLYKDLGGVPLRFDELRSIVLKIIPELLRDNLVFKLNDFRTWHELKEWIKENARLLMVYSKPTPVNLAETGKPTEEELEKYDEMSLDEAIFELGKEANTCSILALVERRQQRRAAFGKQQRAGRAQAAKADGAPAGKGDGKGKSPPMSAGGKPLCTNCGKEGHDKFSCRADKVPLSEQPCFRCGKTGHRSAQCKSGLPAKALEAEDPDIFMMQAEELVSGAQLCVPTDEPVAAKHLNGEHPHAGESVVDNVKLTSLARLKGRAQVTGPVFFHASDTEQESDSTGDVDSDSELSDAENSSITAPAACCARRCKERGFLTCSEVLFARMKNEMQAVRGGHVHVPVAVVVPEESEDESGPPEMRSSSDEEEVKKVEDPMDEDSSDDGEDFLDWLARDFAPSASSKRANRATVSSKRANRATEKSKKRRMKRNRKSSATAASTVPDVSYEVDVCNTCDQDSDDEAMDILANIGRRCNPQGCGNGCSCEEDAQEEEFVFHDACGPPESMRSCIAGATKVTGEQDGGNPLNKEPANVEKKVMTNGIVDKDDEEQHPEDDVELEDFDYEPPLRIRIWRWISQRMEKSVNEEDEEDSVYDPRHMHAELNILEGEVYDHINMAATEGNTQDEYFEECFEVALDSGSGEHVASKKDAPSYTVVPSAGSRAGQHFIAANNARIPNQGEFTLALRAAAAQGKKGRAIKSTFQVANVTRPLWSVGRICDAGLDVKFNKDYASVLTKEGKELCRFQRQGGLYLAKLSLRNPLFRDFHRP